MIVGMDFVQFVNLFWQPIKVKVKLRVSLVVSLKISFLLIKCGFHLEAPLNRSIKFANDSCIQYGVLSITLYAVCSVSSISKRIALKIVNFTHWLQAAYSLIIG